MKHEDTNIKIHHRFGNAIRKHPEFLLPNPGVYTILDNCLDNLIMNYWPKTYLVYGKSNTSFHYQC